MISKTNNDVHVSINENKTERKRALRLDVSRAAPALAGAALLAYTVYNEPVSCACILRRSVVYGLWASCEFRGKLKGIFSKRMESLNRNEVSLADRMFLMKKVISDILMKMWENRTGLLAMSAASLFIYYNSIIPILNIMIDKIVSVDVVNIVNEFCKMVKEELFRILKEVALVVLAWMLGIAVIHVGKFLVNVTKMVSENRAMVLLAINIGLLVYYNPSINKQVQESIIDVILA